MAKKEPKVARIIYHDGDPSKPNTVMEHEGFFFEAWAPSGEGMPYGWSTICIVQLNSIEGNASKDFIHWEILKHVAEWSRMGYTIHYGKRETAYLDEREREEWAKFKAKEEKKKE